MKHAPAPTAMTCVRLEAAPEARSAPYMKVGNQGQLLFERGSGRQDGSLIEVSAREDLGRGPSILVVVPVEEQASNEHR